MRFDVISLFPAMFAALEHGITGRALTRGLAELKLWNPRDYAVNAYGQVDDRPYGGGPGMLMRYEPLAAAIQAARVASPAGQVLYLSPQGQPFTQAAARQLAQTDALILLAGRYEGIDERLLTTQVDAMWSVGDYVVSGGELPAMLLIDSIIRLLPGALGHTESAGQDSFSTGLLDHPHYTRPEVVAEQAVPDVLLSGDHARIRRWRLQQALGRTWQQRPDLLQQYPLSDEEQTLLVEYIDAINESPQPTGSGAIRE
jgi:tRNA (guanine37-N1)-methyltransferase